MKTDVRPNEIVMDNILKEASEDAYPLDNIVQLQTQSDSSLAFLRSFRLQALKRLKPYNEPEQAAIYHSRKLAFIYALPHIIAALAAVVLIVLNVRVVYVGPLPTAGLTALQFAVKLLELLIVGSIASILLSLIRINLLGSSPLPFGAVVAPYKVHDLSYLWSVEFLGSFHSINITFWTKMLVRILVPMMILLAALAGPASAVLLIPRVIDYPSRNILFLLNESTTRFPNYVDLDGGVLPFETDLAQVLSQDDLTFPGGWPTSDTEPLTSISVIPDRSGVRKVQMAAYRSPGQCSSQACPSNMTFVSTSPNKLIGTNAGEATSWLLRGHGHQAYVSHNFFFDSSLAQIHVDDVLTQYVRFDSKPYLDNFIPYSQLLPNSSTSNEIARRFFTDPTYPSGWRKLTNASAWDQSVPIMTILWCGPPESVADHSILLVTGISTPPYTSWSISASTIDAKWIVVDSESSGSFSSVQDIRDVMGASRQNFTITISPRWMGRLFDLAYNSSQVSFSDKPIGTEELWDLTPFIALSLSNIPSDKRLSVNSGQSVVQDREIMAANQISYAKTPDEYEALRKYLLDQGLDHGVENVQLVNNNITDLTDLSRFLVQFSIRDYGYDYSTVTVKLSLAVVGLYVLITGMYILFSLWTALTGSSWDSITEIIALALNSMPPAGFERNTIGINATETCEKTLNIRESENGSMRIIFNGN